MGLEGPEGRGPPLAFCMCTCNIVWLMHIDSITLLCFPWLKAVVGPTVKPGTG